MYDWAERECRIACKRENPDFEFDNKSLNDEEKFDYGCNCYLSALKAYKSLMEDGHSGMSFSFTKNILIRLMEGLPLTPITDEDFKEDENCYGESSEDLAKRGLKSSIQCSRMSSLFRKETLDGKVTYSDVNRSFFVEVENPSDTYQSNDKFLDEMFPIKMPYMPQRGKYEIHAQTFLVDKRNGDFDTRGIFFVITPDGKRVDVNLFQTERDGQWVRISKEEYDELLKRRIDKLNEKVADNLLWTLISNSSPDDVIEKLEEAYEKRSEEDKAKDKADLRELCKFFDNPDNYKYNTFEVHQALCKGELNYKDIGKVPELFDIANYLKHILDDLSI